MLRSRNKTRQCAWNVLGTLTANTYLVNRYWRKTSKEVDSGPQTTAPPEGRFTWWGQGLDSSNTVEIRFFILIRFDACREHKVSGPVCQSCLQNCSFLLQKIPNACRGAYRMESDRSTGIKTSRVEVVVVRTEIGMFQSPRTATRVPFVSLLFRLRNNNTNQLVENPNYCTVTFNDDMLRNTQLADGRTIG